MADTGLSARRRNNFDLLRLGAALQVLLVHAAYEFGFTDSLAYRILNLVPGVPVFFAISGYLVSQSFDRSRGPADYAFRRFRRIYPALWAAVAFSGLAVILLHPIDPGVFIAWLLAQATVFQDWRPEALRSFGTGWINQPLWTISIELSFYALVPLLALLRTRWLAVVALASFAVLHLSQAWLSGIPGRVVTLSFAPWLGMFLIGAGYYRLRLVPPLVPSLIGFAVALALSLSVPFAPLFAAGNNALGLVTYLALANLVFAGAFARPVPLRWDVSYGLYLYHMPVVNCLLVLGIGGANGMLAVLAASAILALASWLLIEKPLLRGRGRGSQPSRIVVAEEGLEPPTRGL